MRLRLKALELGLSKLCADLSLVDWWPVRIVLLALGALAIGLLIWTVRRRVTRLLMLAAVVGLVGANLSAAVNAYYGSYLTLGQMLGLDGENQGSLAALNEQKTPPRAGFVVTVAIAGRKSGFLARPAEVYLPPAWFWRPRPKLPVVMLLHGTPGSPTDWLDGGQAAASADRWAATHHGIAPIIVMPDINGSESGDTECVDGSQGRAETYLSADVPEFIRARFQARQPGQDWAVAGLSEGGMCAIMLALRHPDVYGAFADYGGLLGPRTGTTNDPGDTVAALFGGSRAEFDAHEPAHLLSSRHVPRLHGLFVVGDGDPDPLAATRILHGLCENHAIPTRLVVVPGAGHTFDLWRRAFDLSLPWFADRAGVAAARPENPGPGFSTVDGPG